MLYIELQINAQLRPQYYITVLCYDIRIPICKNCEEYKDCLKKYNWDDKCNYDLLNNNCQQNAIQAIKGCGGGF